MRVVKKKELVQKKGNRKKKKNKNFKNNLNKLVKNSDFNIKNEKKIILWNRLFTFFEKSQSLVNHNYLKFYKQKEIKKFKTTKEYKENYVLNNIFGNQSKIIKQKIGLKDENASFKFSILENLKKRDNKYYSTIINQSKFNTLMFNNKNFSDSLKYL